MALLQAEAAVLTTGLEAGRMRKPGCPDIVAGTRPADRSNAVPAPRGLHDPRDPSGTSAPLTVGLPHRLRIPAPEMRTLAGFTRSARVRPGPDRAPSVPREQRCLLAIGSSAAAAWATSRGVVYENATS
jgi:hypothetical protein